MTDSPQRPLSTRWLKLALLAAFTAAGMSATAAQPAASSPQDAQTAKAILGQLLSIDTTYEKGTVAAVEALRTRFAAAGFSPTDLVVVANPDNPSQSNLIVRMKGHGTAKPLLLMKAFIAAGAP
jgi:hypothetical protein